MTDAPTFEERYIAATTSSNLRVQELTRGDADYLIAVGLAGRPKDSGGDVPEHVIRRHDLAGKLLHLQNEFDRVKRGIEAAKDYQSPMRIKAMEERRKLSKGQHGPDVPSYLMQLAELDEHCVIGGARAHAMLSLKSLGGARDALHRWAEIEATRRCYMVTDAEVARIIGPVLEVFLDQNCYKCGGRGKLGAHGAAQMKCRACGGEGVIAGRRVGATPEQQSFSTYMLKEIEGMLGQFRSRSNGYMHNKAG